ncbi:hypothetical protein DAEQUDRAFT_485752 [Daedalea quercina L-15889]|uniref:Uncharacterized protein n=1 Tax=Daedalea quercina L-15889 TaxID=1314783 RepID=A0A165MT41_9APHY|nr:hypothetical protein DAEQUDRAFT_485752 [Daedalea quercina L-15889]
MRRRTAMASSLTQPTTQATSPSISSACPAPDTHENGGRRRVRPSMSVFHAHTALNRATANHGASSLKASRQEYGVFTWLAARNRSEASGDGRGVSDAVYFEVSVEAPSVANIRAIHQGRVGCHLLPEKLVTLYGCGSLVDWEAEIWGWKWSTCQATFVMI